MVKQIYNLKLFKHTIINDPQLTEKQKEDIIQKMLKLHREAIFFYNDRKITDGENAYLVLFNILDKQLNLKDEYILYLDTVEGKERYNHIIKQYERESLMIEHI